MKVKPGGINWGPDNTRYFYWFDWNRKETRVLGKQCFYFNDVWNVWYCFWWFNIGWTE